MTVNELKQMKRQADEMFVDEHQPSIQRACRIVELSRTAYHSSPEAPGLDRLRRLPAQCRDFLHSAARTYAALWVSHCFY